MFGITVAVSCHAAFVTAALLASTGFSKTEGKQQIQACWQFVVE